MHEIVQLFDQLDEAKQSIKQTLAITCTEVEKTPFTEYGSQLRKGMKDLIEGTLTEVRIPEGINTIHAYAFKDFKNLQKVSISDSVDSIGVEAFSGTALRQPAIGENTKYVEARAFAACDSLTRIDIPENVVYLGDNVFKDCTHVETIRLNSDKLQDFKQEAFLFYNVGMATRTRLILDRKITAIPAYMFFSNAKDENDEDVVVNNIFYLRNYLACKEVKQRAFYACHQLEYITNVNHFESIGAHAFRKCKLYSWIASGLYSTAHLSKIESCAFKKTSLETVLLPHNIEQIRDQAFADCENLDTVVIRGKVNNLNSTAFSGCKNLRNLYLHWDANEVANAPWGAPDTCRIHYLSSATTVQNTPGLQIIGQYYCYGRGTSEDSSITIGGSVLRVVEDAFESDGRIESLYASVAEIESRAFRNCKLLRSAVLDVSHIQDRVFYACRNLQYVIFDDILETIGGHSFRGTGVEHVYFSDGSNVRDIKYCAFKFTQLKSIVLPRHLEALGNQAFEDCMNLEYVVFRNKPNLVSTDRVFTGCTNLKHIYVPWSYGEVKGAPWGAPATTTIHYNSEV